MVVVTECPNITDDLLLNIFLGMRCYITAKKSHYIPHSLFIHWFQPCLSSWAYFHILLFCSVFLCFVLFASDFFASYFLSSI